MNRQLVLVAAAIGSLGGSARAAQVTFSDWACERRHDGVASLDGSSSVTVLREPGVGFVRTVGTLQLSDESPERPGHSIASVAATVVNIDYDDGSSVGSYFLQTTCDSFDPEAEQAGATLGASLRVVQTVTRASTIGYGVFVNRLYWPDDLDPAVFAEKRARFTVALDGTTLYEQEIDMLAHTFRPATIGFVADIGPGELTATLNGMVAFDSDVYSLWLKPDFIINMRSTITPVPAPAGGVLLGLGALAATRRRRPAPERPLRVSLALLEPPRYAGGS